MKFSSPNRWLHVAMLCCVMVEVAELEIFTSGAAHHIWDALIVGLFTTVSARIAAKPRYAFLVLFLGGTAWTIDLFGLRWPPADLESLFWFLFHTVPALMLLRRSGSDWYGVRNPSALARASAPSSEGPVDAPEMRLILNGRPAACSTTARAAIVPGTALGAPAAVKPLTAIVSPSLMNWAASSAVSLLSGFI